MEQKAKRKGKAKQAGKPEGDPRAGHTRAVRENPFSNGIFTRSLIASEPRQAAQERRCTVAEPEIWSLANQSCESGGLERSARWSGTARASHGRTGIPIRPGFGPGRSRHEMPGRRSEDAIERPAKINGGRCLAILRNRVQRWRRAGFSLCEGFHDAMLSPGSALGERWLGYP